MENKVCIKQDMTFPEFLKVIYYQFLRMKIMRRLFIWLVAISIFNTVITIFATPTGKETNYASAFSALWVPFVIAAFFLAFGALAAIVLRIVRKNHFNNIVYTFNEWGMEKTGVGIEYTRPWKGFTHYQESRNFIFLYIPGEDAHVIQKRMFDSNETEEIFRSLISEHLSTK
ncbi:YcxB family protein [Pinibacter aurantiacus]|uniref:YcxB family protein n=1 Tax=Pinibacter aurantiacus TaxID=2851599 RepID=A0A9E2S9J5_9BACT|nr:YcxB family protein [Pinibacter aurantiacus]MBV4357144.1 YcxB family protein [Pinibacter aurantiacus]